MPYFDPYDRTSQLLLLVLILLSWLLVMPEPAYPQVASYGHHGAYLLPDPQVTPGDANLELEADPSGNHRLVDGVEANICAKDFRTGPWRKVSEAEKKAACAEYGVTKGCPGPAYELDHLCSLEFGCSDSLRNIWPQPIKQARIKDHQVEDKLGGPRGLVCQGKISLRDAQTCIEKDWVACAARVKALESK